MAKKKVTDEELDEELEESEEVEEETPKKEKKIKLELDFDMDPIERLRKEIDFSDDPNEKAIGEFLIIELGKDNVLKTDYATKKVTLNKILDFVTNEAKNRLKTKSGTQCVMISDQEVYGMVIHYVHDGDIPEEKGNKYVLTKEEKKSLQEQAREEYLAEERRKIEEAERKKREREEAARKKALEKEKKEREESGQISLFDDCDWGDDDEN